MCRSLDFHRATEVIEIGQELAAIALDSLASGDGSERLEIRRRAGAHRRPCRRPACADGIRHAGSSGLARTRPARRRRRTTPASRPGTRRSRRRHRDRTATGAFSPGGHQRHHRIAVLRGHQVHGADDSAVDVAPVADGHRRPHAGHRAAGRDRVDELNPGSRSNTTSSPVSVSMAVTRSTRSGQSCDGSRCAITVAADRLGDGRGVHRHAPKSVAAAALGCPVLERGQEQRGDVVDTRDGGQLAGARRQSDGRTARRARRRLPDLRHHRRTRRRADQHVGVQQCVRGCFGGSSAMPVKTPVSQAIPASPPPASTSARLVGTVRPRFRGV